jgi:Calcineurin-like phosphoesterase
VEETFLMQGSAERYPSRAPVRAARTGARTLARVAIVTAVLASALTILPAAEAATCGSSGGHTLCIDTPGSDPTNLSGEVAVQVSDSPNSGLVIATWRPAGRAAIELIQMAAPAPQTNNYSFAWPTQKYLDGSGTLTVKQTTSGADVGIPVTLSNGNVTDFKHNLNDWQNYLPAAWTGGTDPKILAVGDGPSNELVSNSVGAAVAAADPPLFLFLGDVYETSTFTELRNHYGVSSIDQPGQGTLWGATADTTQPTVGNHEKTNIPAFQDYWHGRPLNLSFSFGGVLFLDLNSSQNMTAGSSEYNFVKSILTGPNVPACVVAVYHEPAVTGNTTVASNEVDMWKLLASNGVDLVLNGHQHNMQEYKPLDANFDSGTADAHMVQLISGAGGHVLAGVSKKQPGARIAWSMGKTPGLLELTLQGAANGNVATGIGWQWQKVDGTNVTNVHPGSVDCGGSVNHAPTVSAGPDKTVTLPNQVTLQGSVTDDGLPNPPGATTATWSQVSGPAGGTASFGDAQSPTTTASFDTPGTYVLRLTGYDGALQSFDDVMVTANAQGTTVTLDVPVSVSSDDAEESAGTVARANPNLKIVLRAGVNQTVGLRFTGLTIPQGATIQNAYIQFQTAASTTGACSLTVRGQAADNPDTFARTTNNISSRPLTTASVGWPPATWPTVGAHGTDQRTPNLSSIVSEIVNRSGWASGNAMAYIITGTGVRTAESFDGGIFAPILHVEYTP